MSYLLAPLREVSPDRHNRALRALKDGSLSISITFKTDAEVRALVRNGDGREYGVCLTEHGSSCSCPDFLWRGIKACKHIAATAVRCLQLAAFSENPIHLWFPDGTAALCGETHPKRFWQRWTYNALNWPDVCSTCLHTWIHPAEWRAVTKEEHFSVPADDCQATE